VRGSRAADFPCVDSQIVWLFCCYLPGPVLLSLEPEVYALKLIQQVVVAFREPPAFFSHLQNSAGIGVLCE
jgi:hypothetical protein